MKKYVMLLMLVCSVASCVIIAPIVSSFKEVGATASDREELFQKTFKLYHQLIATRNPEQAAKFAVDSVRDSFANTLRQAAKQERVVEHSIASLEFLEESHKAKVHVTVRYYKIPQYLVKERSDVEDWEFVSTAQGWKLRSVEHAAQE